MQGVGGSRREHSKAYLILGASLMRQTCHMLKVNAVGGWKRFTRMGFLREKFVAPSYGVLCCSCVILKQQDESIN